MIRVDKSTEKYCKNNVCRISFLYFDKKSYICTSKTINFLSSMTKKICIYLAMLAMCSACSKNEKLLIGGIGWQEIAIVNKKSGEIEWKHSLSPDEECNDVDMNKRGEILYAYKQGAKLIKRSGEVVWDYKVGENEAVYSASVIESGNYMIAIAGKPLARIVELNGKNEVLK